MSSRLTSFAQAMPSAAGPGFTAFWFAVLLAAVLLAVFFWRRLSDRTYLFYAAYVSAVACMSLSNHELGGWWTARLGEERAGCLSNFLHLPYAVFYLLFVRHYFNLDEWSRAWSRFTRWLLLAYGVTVLWWGADCLAGGSLASEWAILVCNLTTLVASLVLAVAATDGNRPGAPEFLYASVPLTLSGMVLVGRFLAGTPSGGPPALEAFRIGFILHLMIFLLAMGVRHRGLGPTAHWRT